MPLTKLQAKENLIKLVKKYQEVVEQGRINEYKEEATKTAFIQPLLKDVLGWDVNNFNEVSPEERISRGRVDYCLKIDNKPKIFVEAKPLKADISKHIEQAVRYGYNRKGVPFVMLTDFEGIKLFDVTIKPDIRNPGTGLKLNLFWNFYESQFDTLWQLSKESVINGELDKLLLKKPKDRIPVDKAILDDLKQWREALAKDIYKNNPNLFQAGDLVKDAEYLKEITQRILDRIIFMRFCEDRQFVHRRTLKELFEDRTEQVGLNTMVFLNDEFKHYNIIFDSDLFSPKDWEKDLQIDFRVMNKIVNETYNPYQFDVIPLEVLGNIYEQYLGYTIRLTPQQVKYELKPEVRKAGGVYYTPEYIVDYIVKNTVGKILKDVTGVAPPKKNKLSGVRPLRILDPACGSGSFLIRAYEEMLNFYREKKRTRCHAELDSASRETLKQVQGDKNVGQGFSLAKSSDLSLREAERRGNLTPEPIQKELDLKHSDTEVRLSILEKAEILKNHIFGVDIDEQAVEVTKLSLMLKMLEGEFGIIPGRNILPMLDKNICCGNSLISGSPLELKKYFGDDYYKTKPFNWEEEFKEVFKDGGFDVVIGNPPYIFTRELITESEKEYYNQYYKYTHFKINTYLLFVEKGFYLLNKKGMLSFIIPNNWLSLETAAEFRHFILTDTFSIIVINSRDKVFKDASVDTSILIFAKIGKKEIILSELKNENIKLIKKNDSQVYLNLHNYIISYDAIKSTTTIPLCKKIEVNSVKLDTIAEVKNGVQAYTVGEGTPIQTEEMKLKRIYHSNEKKNKLWIKYVDGVDVCRYYLGWSGQYIKYGNNLTRPRKPELFIDNRLLVRQIPGSLPYCILSCFVKDHIINDNNSMIVKIQTNDYNIKYILGILNSALMSFWFVFTFGKLQRKVFPQFKIKELSVFPIRSIDFTRSADKKLHDNLVALVDVVLDLNKKIQSAKGNAKEQIQREITKTDNAIDDIVYRLYNITEQEKKIIEGE